MELNVERVIQKKVFTIVKKFSFDAAHLLQGDEGKCGRLHGHTWTGEVHCRGTSGLLKDGILVDFRAIKSVVELMDHQDLNWALGCPRPTAEVIAAHLLDSIPFAVKVILNETEGNQVIVEHQA
jgi:6-pyruvoyl tetrahydropterin synthase/QueD family protein